jgi:hypothetical protein
MRLFEKYLKLLHNFSEMGKYVKFYVIKNNNCPTGMTISLVNSP